MRFAINGRNLSGWQSNRERRPHIFPARHFNHPAVRLNDGSGNRQTKTAIVLPLHQRRRCKLNVTKIRLENVCGGGLVGGTTAAIQVMKRNKTFLLIAAMIIQADCAFAQTWTQTGLPNKSWTSVASSADGRKLAAAAYEGIYTSTNYGSSWLSNNVPSNPWLSVASSADGIRLVAVALSASQPIWISTNSGITWMPTSAPATNRLGKLNPWVGIASSADGTKLVGVAGGNAPLKGAIFISADSGASWNETDAPIDYWSSVSSSADGSKLAAVVRGNAQATNGGSIYISTNSGAVWTQANAPTNLRWTSIASSADGRKLAATDEATWVVNHFVYDSVYTSDDYGANWTSNNVKNTGWASVSMSADGAKLIAVAQSGYIYTSINSGANWISNTPPGPFWQAVASSADGNRLLLVTTVNGVYSSYSTSTPQLNLAPASTNLTLRWTIPSTNFVLQQSSNLVSWADVTNMPVLNLTNLQNQLTLSPSNGSGFYRLKTP